MEQRRLLLAFGLSLLVIVVYQEIVVRRYPQSARQKAVETGKAPSPAPPGQAPIPAVPLAAGEVGAAPGDVPLVTIETDVYRIAITPTGARLSSLALNRFRQSIGSDSPPLDLVHPGVVLPATVTLGSDANDARVAYQPDREGLVLHGSDRGAVIFTGQDAAGAPIEKRYDFVGDGYTFDVTVTSGDRGPAGLLLTPIPTDRADARGAAAHGAGVALSEHKLLEKPLTDIEKGAIDLKSPSWVGFESQYFLSVAVPKNGSTSGLLETIEDVPTARVEQAFADRKATFVVYAGPKDRDELSKVGYDLDRALDFGWFWFIAVPLLQALRMLQRVTGNWGVAIIALTALTKLVTTPLTQTTFRNMREMQKIQPQMAKIRERYKDDQVALQKEMMELYRRHRVNPFSGCLPMVFQLPIFVGLYNALSHAIELRHAPFILWINDLSAPDRLMILGFGIPVLTLLMGVSMLVQQWISPQQGDPTQQRMMMIMPVVFTFMFINFPSGLVLYWLVNNVLTIGQQYMMLRSSS